MMKHHQVFVGCFLLTSLSLAACASTPRGVSTHVASATATQSQTLSSQLASVTATVSPTLTLSPEPILTPTPTPDTVLNFTQLAQLGRGTVEQVAVSPDGHWLVASGNQGMRLYDAVTLQLVRQLEPDDRPVTAISWGTDSRHLAVAGDPDAVRIWDIETGQRVQSLAVTDGLNIRDVAWSPVAEQVAVLGIRDGQSVLQIWGVQTGKPLNEFIVSNAEGVVWSPDGTRLAFYRLEFIQWIDLRVPNPTPILMVNPGIGPVHSVAWSPDGTQLAAGSGEPNPFGPGDYTVRVWDVAAGEPSGTLRYEWDVPLPAISVSWSPDGQWLAAGTENRTIHVWDVQTGEARPPLSGHGAGVVSLTWLADSTRLVSAGRDGTIRQWNVERGLQTRSASDERASPPLTLQVAWSPDGRQLALAGQDGTIQLWDTATWEQYAVLVGHRGAVNGVAWSPDGSALASGGDDGYLRIWDVASRQVSLRLPQQGEPKSRITSVAWQPVAEYYIAAGGYPLQVWDPDGALVWEGDKDESVVKVAWSPNGKWLVIVPEYDSPKLYEGSTGIRQSRNGKDAGVTVLSWSGNSQLVLLGEGAGKSSAALLWDIESEKEPKVIRKQIHGITAVAWRPNDDIVAVGSNSGQLQLWNISTQETVLDLFGHTAAITSLAWSPDGRFAVSSSEDGTVRVWGAP